MVDKIKIVIVHVRLLDTIFSRHFS